MKHEMTIVWGERNNTDPIRERTKTYVFNTSDEMHEFVSGAEQCIYWNGFKVKKCSDPSYVNYEYGD
jgi:hypothetical protein